jgi:Carboxypeptidase regulatory-like domain
MHLRPVLRVVALALTFGAFAAAQQAPSGPRPARDTPAQTAAKPATGRIAGRVLTADTGRPVKRARVLLNAPEIPGGRGTLTDDQGAFDFTELPQGRYTLAVSKSGFVNLAYGQRRPLQPGTPLQLNEGQQIRSLEFRLPRGSVIAGHVFDEAGDPLPGVTVRAMAYRYAQGSRQLVSSGNAQTDDRGEYRIWGLNPGEYYITAVARNFNVGQAGPFGGRGGRGGGPALSPNVGGALPPPAADSPEQSGYAPTYYPGVESIAEARAVTLSLGAETLDINFGVLLVRTSRITGRVLASDGTAVSTGNVVLTPEGQQSGRPGSGTGFGGRIQWDGAFTIVNVPPGRYVLRARGDDWEVPQFSMMPVSVAGGDLTGLNVMLTPGASISGSVTLQRAQSVSADITQFRVSAPSADGANLGPQQNARVDQAGRFTLDGVAAGSHWIRAQAPRGWVLKSVTADGRDVTDNPIDLRSGQRLANVAVVFTDKLSEINGTVTDEQGTAITDFTMLAFPVESTLWIPQSRYIMTTRPDQNGTFQIRGLPPGEYFLAAVDPTEAGEWFEPSYLDEHRVGAARLLLGDGDVKTQNVRIATGR